MKTKANRAIEFLLARGHLPVLYWLKKDILEVPVERDSRNLSKFSSRVRILEVQHPDGSWCERFQTSAREDLKSLSAIYTLLNLFKLYDYGCGFEEAEIQRGIDFLFSTQTPEGDFRGNHNGYTPAYHALVLEILCRYGLDKDKRVQKGFRWLLTTRLKEGGWAIPCQDANREYFKGRLPSGSKNKAEARLASETQPFSPQVTGIILRALAESPTWHKSKEAIHAGEMLLGHFFEKDQNLDKGLPSPWEEISYPFWRTHVLSSIDSLSKLGFDPKNEKIQQALDWLMKRQNSQGFWEPTNPKLFFEDHLWLTLSILRILKRFGLIDA